MLNRNEFGELVRAYRKQRGWTQQQLAERWEHTQEYVSQVEAAGFTTLNRPQHALEIYKNIDGIFRPMRNQGSYLIDKSQVYFHLGDFERGLKFATQGIHLASIHRSRRQIARLETTYQRLLNTSVGKKQQMRDFQELIVVNKSKQADW
ncbi:MAG TPA: helix-turn-helix domain-containing protein [Ktedonobacteraceae bacterium]